MSIRNEIKQQQKEALKGKPFSYKLSYFFSYYKFHVLFTLAWLLFFICLLRSILSASAGNTLHGLLFHTLSDANTTAMEEDFAAYAELSAEAPPLLFETGLSIDPDGGQAALAASTRTVALIREGEVDFLLGTKEDFLHFADGGCFLDVRTYLSDEDLLRYADDLLYAKDENGSSYPAALCLKASPAFSRYGLYDTDTAIFAILYNAPHLETAKDFLCFLTQAD